MAAVTIRNIPEATSRALKHRAAKNGRSTEAEIRHRLNRQISCAHAGYECHLRPFNGPNNSIAMQVSSVFEGRVLAFDTKAGWFCRLRDQLLGTATER